MFSDDNNAERVVPLATGETRGGLLEIKANLARFLVKIMTNLFYDEMIFLEEIMQNLSNDGGCF